jgi:hypothetical protein
MPDDCDWRQDRYAPFAGEPVRGADAWEPSGIGPNATTQPLASGQLPPPRIVDADAPANQPRRRSVSRRLVLATAAAGSVALGAGAGLGWWSTHHGGQAAPAVPQQMSHLLRRAGFGMRSSEAAAYAAPGFNAAVDRLLDPASVADPLESQLASLKLDLTAIGDMQRWFLLRMVFSQRPGHDAGQAALRSGARTLGLLRGPERAWQSR